MPRSACLVLKPSEIRFTQDSISDEFGHNSGETLEQTFRELLYGEKSCDRIRRVGVVKWESKYWVVSGNRRLYVFKKLEEVGRVNEITVNIYNLDMDKFNRMKTTKNEGRSVRIRGRNNLEYRLTQVVTEWRGRGRPTTGLLAAYSSMPSSRGSSSYSSPSSPVYSNIISAHDYQDSTRTYRDYSTTSYQPRTEPQSLSRSTGARYQSSAGSGSTTNTPAKNDSWCTIL